MERRDNLRLKARDGSFGVLRSGPAIACQMNSEPMENTEIAKLPTKLAKIIDISPAKEQGHIHDQDQEQIFQHAQ